MAVKKGKYQVVWVDINSVVPDPDNPRSISKPKFEELKESIAGFPEGMDANPLKIGEGNIILAGNQRHKACKELGWKKIPVMDISDLPKEKQEELIVKDNLHSGEFRWGKAITRFGEDRLIKWGANTTGYVPEEQQQKEIEENQKRIDAMEIQFNEHHDYVVFLFDNANDFLKVVSDLGLKKIPTSLSPKTKTLGLGRVVPGKKLITLLKNQK